MTPPFLPPPEEPESPQPSPETAGPSSEPAEAPEAAPADQQPRRHLTCWHCDSEDLTRGLHLGFGTESGYVGIKFAATPEILGIGLRGLEPLRVTLCNKCGTVARLSVKTERDWR